MTLALTQQSAQPLTIYLAAGVYSGLSFSNMNFAGGLVIASADPLHPAIITGGTAYGAGLNVNNSSGITFSHIDLQTPASGSNTFVVQNSSNITFDSVHIYGTNVDPSLDANRGLYVTNSNYVTVTNSTIDHEQVGLVIANTGSATNNHITVTNNSFHDLEIDGIESGGTNYLNISGNSFTNFQEQPGDHSDAIQLWTTSLNQGSHDIVISNNVISTGIGTPPQGIFITDDSGVKPFVNVTISNNVLSDTLYNGITVSDGQNITVTGNTIRQLDAVNSSWIWLDNVTGGNISGNTMNIALHETGTNTGLVRSGNVVNSNYAPLTPAAPATPGPSATPTPAQTQTLASLSALQTALAAALYSPTAAVFSSDGAKLAFSTNAPSSSSVADVYVENMSTKAVSLIGLADVGVGGGYGNDTGQVLGFSADGQSLIFLSKATNLTGASDSNGAIADIYKKNLTSGATTLLTSGGSANRFANGAVMSSNGSTLAFAAADSTLATTHDATSQIYTVNASTGVVTEISHPVGISAGALGVSSGPVISADGSKIAFVSTGALIAGDTNGQADIYVYSVGSGALVRLTDNQGGATLTANTFTSSLDKLYYTATTAGSGSTPPDTLHAVTLSNVADQVIGVGLSGALVSPDGLILATNRDVLVNGSWRSQAELMRLANGAVADLHGGATPNSVATSTVLGYSSTGTVAFLDGASSGINLVTAAASANLVNGGAGGHVLTASASDTVLTGGGGSDTFVIQIGGVGITNFNHSQHDQIDLSGLNLFHNLSDVLAASFQSGSDTIVNLGATGSLVLSNVAKTSLTAADFTLVTLSGTSGADRYVVDSNSETITNFSHAQGDTINLSGVQQFRTFADVRAALSQSGANTVLTLGAGALTLNNVQMSTLTAQDFGLPSSLMSDFTQTGQDSLLFREASTGNWGFMQANLSGGQTWHPIGPSSADYAAIAHGDFNGDGILDTAFRQTSTGAWGFMTISPTGGQIWHPSGNASLAYDAVATGDIVGDGSTAVVFRNASSGDWGYMTNTGPSQVWHSIGSTGSAYSVVGSGDFNGDGVFDVAFRENSVGAWGYMSINPSGGQTWHGVGSASTAYAPVASADFLGTGQTEVAFRNAATGDWGFMQANTGGGQTWHPIGVSSTAYSVIGTGDYNGDGIQDVAFRNTTTGDWGYMTVNPTGGETWHGVGSASLAYGTI